MSLSPAFVGAAAAAARPPRRAATRGVPAAAAAASSSPWAGRASAVVAGGAAASPRRRRHPHPPHPHTHGSGGGGGPAPAPGPRHPPATPPRADASDLPPLPLSEAAVQEVLVEARDVLGTMFGSSAENRDIGITGCVWGGGGGAGRDTAAREWGVY